MMFDQEGGVTAVEPDWEAMIAPSGSCPWEDCPDDDDRRDVGATDTNGGRDFNDDFVQFGSESVRAALSAADWPCLQTPAAGDPALDPNADFSEQYASEVWVGRNRARWRFDHGIGRWFEFVGTHWRRDGVGAAFHSMAELAKTGGRPSKAAPPGQRSGFVRGLETFARVHPALQ